MKQVLLDIIDERNAQDAKWGKDQQHPLGRDVGDEWRGDTAIDAKAWCAQLVATNKLTWEDILAEELAEAFAEEDPEFQRQELVQCAAVIVAMIEMLDRQEKP